MTQTEAIEAILNALNRDVLDIQYNCQSEFYHNAYSITNPNGEQPRHKCVLVYTDALPHVILCELWSTYTLCKSEGIYLAGDLSEPIASIKEWLCVN